MKEDNELSVKELFVELSAYFKYARSKWWLVVLVCLVIIGGSVVTRYLSAPLYTAKLTYLVETGGGGGGNVILSQLGLGGGQAPNVERIQQIALSDQVGLKVLYEGVELNGKRKLLGNYLIDELELREKWREEEYGFAELELLDSIPFPISRDYASLHKALLNLLYVGGGPDGPLIRVETDALTVIAEVTVVTTDELLSIHLANTEFDKLREFYTIKSQVRQLDNIAVSRTLSDSLQRELTNVQKQLLQAQDRRSDIVFNRNRYEVVRLEQEQQKLILAYTEAYKNLQIAEFTFRSQRPNIEVIDRPFAPIYGYRYPIVRLVMLSGIISVIVALALLFFAYLWKKILTDI
ncbi:hypothetical protein FUA23_03910 [Neolewinella aurantiaca]|uniref:Polysaccharide chain length determinant N-terminal domain-containing protein n=1 Tax=Neolewinella aurantiaca TaxID=2602767 RepID=A0A5C7FWB2_9BACT|nr:hypothetical protein [Neolewinella aurantiaca]TXF90955.1 hypothetical protein FUA23_03910 [Neolewinella aurantiaca]